LDLQWFQSKWFVSTHMVMHVLYPHVVSEQVCVDF